MRAIIFLVFIILLFMVIKSVLQGISTLLVKQNSAENIKQQPSEKMVSCAYCQVHLPQKDAFTDGDNFFCSAEHKKIKN